MTAMMKIAGSGYRSRRGRTRVPFLALAACLGWLLGSGLAHAGPGAVPGVSLSDITCPATPVGTTSTCLASQTLTANGAVTMTVSPYLAETGVMAIALGDCVAPKSFQNGETCHTGPITFTPNTPGPYVTYLLLPDGAGPGSTLTEKLSGTGTSATPVVTPTSVSCPATLVGSNSTCQASFTLTASGGALSIVGAPAGLDPADFTLDPGSCGAGTALAAGATCATGPLTFHPVALGSPSDLITLTTSSATAPTLTITVQGRATGAVWVGSGYGSCSGGTGLWTEGAWAPETGCGSYTQTRTVSCIADPDSGMQTQAATCQGPGSTALPDSACEASVGAKPASQVCTPAVNDALCGASLKPAASQPGAGGGSCAYAWHASGFGACTGGSGQWTPGPWTPVIGCGATAQTRSETCAFTAGSGSQAQTVTCQASDGTAAADSQCAGVKPATMQGCTPTDPAVCGPALSLSQTSQFSNGCPAGTPGAAPCTPTPDKPYCLEVPLGTGTR